MKPYKQDSTYEYKAMENPPEKRRQQIKRCSDRKNADYEQMEIPLTDRLHRIGAHPLACHFLCFSYYAFILFQYMQRAYLCGLFLADVG